ncbi:Ig-like domain-containing protein [Acetanaerobacterium elongatum]|uniref:Ig-like domain-containing protein n=1 Tax=Acetanaerobacterium elongatum TaxID=258515 RepID=UPI003BFA796F
MNVGIVNAAQKENTSYGSSAKETKTIPVKGITVSPSYASVIISDTIYLSATITPSNATDKSVTWSSSYSNVASFFYRSRCCCWRWYCKSYR